MIKLGKITIGDAPEFTRVTTSNPHADKTPAEIRDTLNAVYADRDAKAEIEACLSRVPTSYKVGSVDRARGIIHGFSVIQRGEALGHKMWIDDQFLQAIATAGNAVPRGIKSRFTHPGLSSDGMGKALGRVSNFRVDGDRVLADLDMLGSAAISPDGDLRNYVMSLADEAPDMFGASIVFERDVKSENEFSKAYRGSDGVFLSPDPGNSKNFTHARLKALKAADIVDSPAANRDGFFCEYSTEDMLQHADHAMPYILGLSDEAPVDFDLLGIHPERVRTYVQGYLARNNLSLGGTVMGDVEAVALSSESLQRDYPDAAKVLITQGEKAGHESGFAAGTAAERERVVTLLSFAIGAGLIDEAFSHVQKGTKTSEAQTALMEAKRATIQAPVNPGPNKPEEPKGSEWDERGKLARQYAAEHNISYREALLSVGGAQ